MSIASHLSGMPPVNPPEGFMTAQEAADMLSTTLRSLPKICRDHGVRVIVWPGRERFYHGGDIDSTIDEILFSESGSGAGWVHLTGAVMGGVDE